MNRPCPPAGDYAVPRPLVTDAVGAGLRRALRIEATVPPDMLALLARLDRPGNA